VAHPRKQFKKSRPPPETIVRTVRPFREFIRLEAAGGIILIICVVIAIIWANSPVGETYTALWGMQIAVGVTQALILKPLSFWISDLLMTLFFFVIGLEIKRELLIGWLSSVRQAILPVIAAIGGMIVPAAIYSLLNPVGTVGSAGWAIPVSTDIAIVLGILSLFGSRIPTPLKVFVATLAIVDDIGGILVIALFYSHGIEILMLGLSALIILGLFILNYLSVRKKEPYALLGICLWASLYYAGIHPTVAGVLLAVTIPATKKIDYSEFLTIADQLLDRLRKIIGDKPEDVDAKIFLNTTQTLEISCQDAGAPLQRLEHDLAPWSAFIVIPLFALANAGVIISPESLYLMADPISIGIILGLVIGKPVGIIGAVLLCDKIGLVKMPETFSLELLVGVALLCGVGFTIATFISALAFGTALFLDSAKTAILIASLVSAVLGVLYLRRILAPKIVNINSGSDDSGNYV
jgi:NhaA family Na+:H+ antiporter